MPKLLPKERLHVTGSSQLKPHRPAMRSNGEFKGEERAAALFVDDKGRQQWVICILKEEVWKS
jgi:hypothetical protein